MRIIGNEKNLRIFWNNRSNFDSTSSTCAKLTMAAKTVLVEAAIEELTGAMRENSDADYELSLSDSEEETTVNDESSDDQTGSENHVVATRNATPTAANRPGSHYVW